MIKSPVAQDNRESNTSSPIAQTRWGIFFTLRTGLLCMAGVAILTAVFASIIFSIISSNFGSITHQVIPTIEEALHLTDLARTIDSRARDLPSMHEPFNIASTAYQLRQLRDELIATINKIEPSLMESKELDTVRNSIKIMDRQLEHLRSLVQRRSIAEELQLRHVKALEDIYRRIESLGMMLGESHDKNPDWPQLLMAMLRSTELLIASMATKDPKHVIENQNIFKEQLDIVETNINRTDAVLRLQINIILEKMRRYQPLFHEKLEQIQLGLQIRTAIKSLAVMDRLIDQVGELSARLNNGAKTKAMEMNRISVQLRWLLSSISIICIAGLVGLLIFINRRIVKRMKKLQIAMRSHVAGEPQPISTSGSDEISDMAYSFMYYIDKVKRREERIQEHTRELNATLNEHKKMEQEMKKNLEILERFSKVTIDREKKMIKLKEEINELHVASGKREKYKIVE
ncbi:hypothetical protein QUF70_10935 [Desulfobacterales bacterium HSG17]|nr:hypothetical protein [Desulfobacterales bacterium HSG17]